MIIPLWTCHQQSAKVSHCNLIRSVRDFNLDFNTVDFEVEFDENAVEDTSLMKMDTHIIPLEKLVERFNSDLTKGLSNDTVTQHRATYGQNKLTPSRPPSLLWMFIKQLLIGFNGVLWLATLFAFLTYVSSLFFFFHSNIVIPNDSSAFL